MSSSNKFQTVACVFIFLVALVAVGVTQTAPQGTLAGGKANAAAAAESTSITPFATETGKVSMSLDAFGTNQNFSSIVPAAALPNEVAPGNIRVQKPVGATVRKAYLLAATVPSFSGDVIIAPGDITLDGNPISFSTEVDNPSLPNWHNYLTEVTSIVKPKVDAAAPGIVYFDVEESSAKTLSIDGTILAVILNDPNQVADNTVIFLFGAQNPSGDTFNINLTNPINKSAAGFALDFSLGISFSDQDNGPSYPQQYSIVDVNGQRLTSAAGGSDDGFPANGNLITVGGIGDSNANPPDPNATPTTARSDDELYSLIPFVNNGDHLIQVNTSNPSNDDNIFFAAFFVGANNAVIGPTPTPTPGNGPLTPYYLTAGEQHKNWVVQMTSLVSSWPQKHVKSVGESPLAVTDFVKTLGTFYTNVKTLGSRYTLAGAYVGPDYPYPSIAGAAFWDGASDGTNNYSVDFAHGGVYKFDSNWANPVKLFSTSSDYLGITFDTLDNTFWLAKFHTGLIEHRSMNGALLSSFNLPFTGASCLALDPQDRTLWMGSQNAKGTFYQYELDGTQVRARTYTFLKTQNTLGGEFPVPTPTPTPAQTVNVSVSPSSITEGDSTTFTITRSVATAQSLVVHYTMKGTATDGSDYTLSGTPNQVTIPANQTSATVTLGAEFDEQREGTETAKMVLQPGAGYTLGPNNKATVNISDPPS